MAEPTLYLFDGYNLLHAGSFDGPTELIDRSRASSAHRVRAAILVFDGAGQDRADRPARGPLRRERRRALERLAAEHRGREAVCLVSSDSVIRGTSGQEVRTVSSERFLTEPKAAAHSEDRPHRLADRLDAETRERLERLRRGE